jgi:hypothetical protein
MKMLEAEASAVETVQMTVIGSEEVAIIVEPFDYSALDETQQALILEQRNLIQVHVRQECLHIIEIGRALLTIKESLPHGQFGKWLRAEFGWSDRTARNYMNAAKEFGDKTEIVADLEPTALYALAAKSTPEDIREEFLEKIEAGIPLQAADVRSAVAEAKSDTTETSLETSRSSDTGAGRLGKRNSSKEDSDPGFDLLNGLLNGLQKFADNRAPEGLVDAVVFVITDRHANSAWTSCASSLANWAAVFSEATTKIEQMAEHSEASNDEVTALIADKGAEA